MTALARIPDFGERIAPDGQPIDEIFDILVSMPHDDGPDTVMLAAEIAQHRCTGRNLAGIRRALMRWTPEGWAQ